MRALYLTHLSSRYEQGEIEAEARAIFPGAIVAREALTRRHPALKSILERWPSAGVLVATAKR